MRVEEALADITEIRQQLSRSRTFRGYRSWSVAVTAGFGFSAAAIQSVWIPHPLSSFPVYLTYWTIVAAASVTVSWIPLLIRCLRESSSFAKQLTIAALESLAPSLVVGALLAIVALLIAPELRWMLPGLWSLVFGLGIFASVSVLPRAVQWSGLYYIVAGVVVIVTSRETAPLAPWTMAATFGVGQTLTALILYLTLERSDESNTK